MAKWKKNDGGDALLWRLEGADMPGVSYLFGTMHVRDRRAFRLLAPVQECILACDAFATEFNLDEAGDDIDPARLSLPPGLTLDRLLPPRQYDKLRRILRRAAGLELDPLRDKLPLLIANLVDERMLAREMPFALDEALWRFARLHDRRLLGIESYREQLDILRQIPLDEQVRGLLALGRHIRRHRRHLLHMTERYEQADIRRLYQSARRGAQGLRRLMLYERNALMAGRIAAIAREQTLVAAIGAAHLAGGKGVLRRLKQVGLRVRPVL